MAKNAKNPYSFDSCHICMICRQAESKGITLNEKELIQAFKVQDAQSKTIKRKSKKS